MVTKHLMPFSITPTWEGPPLYPNTTPKSILVSSSPPRVASLGREHISYIHPVCGSLGTKQ